MIDNTALQTVRDLAIQTRATVDGPDGRKYTLVANGFDLKELKPHEAPLGSFISQSVVLSDRASFIAYVNAYKSNVTRIFLDTGATVFKAVFDYHTAPAGAEEALPNRNAHIAVYSCPLSEEWAAWSQISGKAVSQRDFAEFLEERALDVTSPDSATLLEVAQRLQVDRKVTFVSGMNIGNGNQELTFTEEDNTTAGKQRIQVPSKIEIAIPVFVGEDRYKVNCLFRYRLNDGKLSFIVKMVDRQLIVQDALKQMRDAIANDTGIVAFAGRI